MNESPKLNHTEATELGENNSTDKPFVMLYSKYAQDSEMANKVVKGLQAEGFSVRDVTNDGMPGPVSTIAHAFTATDIANAQKIFKVMETAGVNMTGFAYPNFGYVYMTPNNLAVNLATMGENESA